MNKIYKLFDPIFVSDLFKEKVLPFYPEAEDIGTVKIKPYKKLIWNTTYHVVIDFLVEFKLKKGGSRKTHIVCSAHSSEPRDISYGVLKYLWRRRLGKGVVLPRPLFYSDYFRGSFYRALDGKDLFYFIRKKNKEMVIDLVAKSGLLFARLHKLALKGNLPQLDPNNSRISTVIPGVRKIISEVNKRYGETMAAKIAEPYYHCINFEEEYFKTNPKLCLVHGDAHTENIIRVSKRKIGLIDFTDFSLGDQARDIGTFIQQLDYKLEVKFNEAQFTVDMKNLFLEKYLEETGLELNKEFQDRLNNYYIWTSLRTAAYWLLRDKAEPERAITIFKKVDYFKDNNLLAQN